jgi:signal peptidase I
MSRDLMDLETGKFVFHYPGEEDPEPETEAEQPAEPEPGEPEPEISAEQSISEPEEYTEDAEEEEQETEVRISRFFRFIIRLAILAVILYGLFTYVLGLFTSYDDRMYPFINDGDIVITYRLGKVKPGDAILYRNPDTGNTSVSRIAAEGAETIDISEAGEVLISGTPSALTVYEATEKAHTGTITYPYTMTEGGYFLLNDHRAVDIDSRQFGEIKKDALLGKVILVIRWKGF